MQEQILDLLRKHEDYVSGEEVSRHLSVSRQALWKHIQDLREAGYDIVAVPHLGYKFIASPDRLYPFELGHRLHTKVIGKRVYYFDAVTSTMDIAMKLGNEGYSEGTVVAAETQTRGKGRLGRNWVSPKYKGIYLSLLLRPKIAPNMCPVLTLLAAASVAQAVKEVCGLQAQIKWPNDLLIRHKKAGGILTELNAQADEINFVVIGIGINVNNGKNALLEGATSLKEETGAVVSRVALAQEILRTIEEQYFLFRKQGSQPILEKWRAFNVTLGKTVKASCRREHIEGEALDIDADGGLLIRRSSGLIEKVMAGDIVHCR
jgi:BirA family biotin operon repressor/biotin-[acetyl-CoA-carboxylase] ligase